MEQLPFYLQLIFGHPGNADISLILLVGAGRFERPTPCAQGIGTYTYGNSIKLHVFNVLVPHRLHQYPAL